MSEISTASVSPSGFRFSFTMLLCYPVRVPMTKPISMINWRSPRALTSLLSVVLVLAGIASPGVQCQTAQDYYSAPVEPPARVSIQSKESPRHNHALTSVPGQRVAGDISKQNRIKHFVSHNSLAPRTFGTPAAIVRQRLALTDQSVLYLSFRLSRPGGRAPPASA